MKIKYLIFYFLMISFSTFFIYSMQETLDKLTSSMVKINKWQDVAPFADRVVAYVTNAHYFGSDKGYPISSDSRLKYGYIGKVFPWGTGDGYTLIQLLKVDDSAGHKPLNDYWLGQSEETYLFMRLASKEELAKMIEAVPLRKAKFEYMFDEPSVHSIITESLNKLPPAVPSLASLNIKFLRERVKTGKIKLEDLEKALPSELIEQIK